MRKLFVLPSLFLLLTLLGCSSAPLTTDDIAEKKEEMSKEEALKYLEEVTYRLVEATLIEEGSFEQTSTLQAALRKCESITEEIKEKYETFPLVEEIIGIALKAEIGAENGLDGNYALLDIHLSNIIEDVKEISVGYLDGELPISIGVLEQ